MEYTDQNIIELYNQNLTLSEMATAFGKTRGIISSKIKRMRKKDPDALPRRVIGKHPRGITTRKYSKTPKPVKAEVETAVVKKLPPNKYTFRTGSSGHKQMSKAEMREMLRKAVENT